MKLKLIVILLLALPLSGWAGTKGRMIWNCNHPSGIEVVDLACNIYWETGPTEPLAGKYLVALSVLNRVESPHYPDTFSEVSYEIRRTRSGRAVAQYSWRLDGKPDKVHNSKMWIEAMAVAADVIDRRHTIRDITYGCKWYHRAEVVAEERTNQRNIWNWRQHLTEDYRPYWAPQYFPTVRIGNHQCYATNEAEYLEVMTRMVRGDG